MQEKRLFFLYGRANLCNGKMEHYTLLFTEDPIKLSKWLDSEIMLS